MRLTDFTNMIGITTPKLDAPVAPPEFNADKLPPKEVYLSWQSLGRPEKKEMNLKFMKTGVVIGVVVSLLLAIMGEFFLILVVGSIIFISYVLSKVPPEQVKYEVSNHGIMAEDKTYYWHELKDFFFINSGGMELLAVSTFLPVPARLFVSFLPQDKQRLQEIMAGRLNFLKVEPVTFVDKMYNSVLDKFNFGGKDQTLK